jgi:hypothetical protein
MVYLRLHPHTQTIKNERNVKFFFWLFTTTCGNHNSTAMRIKNYVNKLMIIMNFVQEEFETLYPDYDLTRFLLNTLFNVERWRCGNLISAWKFQLSKVQWLTVSLLLLQCQQGTPHQSSKAPSECR